MNVDPVTLGAAGAAVAFIAFALGGIAEHARNVVVTRRRRLRIAFRFFDLAPPRLDFRRMRADAIAEMAATLVHVIAASSDKMAADRAKAALSMLATHMRGWRR